MNLSIDNVVTVSIAQVGQGVGQYNTSNLAIFTNEVKGGDFGSLGYKIYLSPTDVATDFGTDSKTYKMALSIFSQQPNILANNGYLVVIPTTAESQLLAFSATPTSGAFVINWNGDASASIAYNDTAAEVQTKIRDMDGLEGAVVTGSITSGTGLTVTFNGVQGNVADITITGNTLDNAGAVSVTVTTPTTGETLDAAITRTTDLIEYFGILTTSILGETETLAAAAVVQALNKIMFLVQKDEAQVTPETGILSLITEGGFTRTRGLFYGADDVDPDDADVEALRFCAAYAGRGLSVNFNGSNTTINMHMKSLTGINADPSMDQTLLNSCKAAGADIYASFQGVAKVYTSGENQFFDQVYNLLWFVGAIKVAVFNVLAQVGTKITQTEDGIATLTSACRDVCEQSITNRYLAPGSWTSPDTFGNQVDLYANILQRGYYIYSQPVSQQLPSARAAREAPVIQIAAKEAGAINTSNIIVYINQ